MDTKNKKLISKIYLSISKLDKEIAESIHNPDPIYLSDHLHKLKGCVGQVGFIELQEKVVELENIHEKNQITEKDIKELKI
ncbi:Hpt domain-containing protein [Candidatus Williamhamiltonella defendens]|uniref:Hpt domain-containing protein n=1 Tax=Candidatus Williamhamiltonella defendens TaxID=138072 RepID=UPI001F330266|nr:Hpt domain-containing protein [Candidatus Hamiltonella defensa]